MIRGAVRPHWFKNFYLILSMKHFVKIDFGKTRALSELPELPHCHCLSYCGESLKLGIILISEFEMLRVQRVLQVETNCQGIQD